jgi:hypothetical protein
MSFPENHLVPLVGIRHKPEKIPKFLYYLFLEREVSIHLSLETMNEKPARNGAGHLSHRARLDMLARRPTGQQPASVPRFDNRHAARQHCPSSFAITVGAGEVVDERWGRLRRPRTPVGAEDACVALVPQPFIVGTIVVALVEEKRKKDLCSNVHYAGSCH